MANEIKVNINVSMANGVVKHSFAPGQVAIDQAATGFYDSVASIGTTEETQGPNFGDVGTERLCVLYNFDATNYVQVGFATGVYGLRLRPNSHPTVIELEPGATLYLKSNTAACKVRVIVYEA